MRIPKFWRTKGIISFLLIPFSFIYYFLSKTRTFFIKPISLQVPTICIGNVNAGGAGNTPTAIEIAKICIENNFCPNVIGSGMQLKLVELKGNVKLKN